MPLNADASRLTPQIPLKHQIWRHSMPAIWGRDIRLAVADFEETRSDDEVPLQPLSLERSLPDTPYHVSSFRQKRFLVYIVSLAGLFSPLSSNIYFPALGAISKEFYVSASAVALTITVYMVVQGFAPSVWGPISDVKGRRPVFIGTFLVYLAANVGLALSPNFASLMIFRAVQAGGSAATISIGAGVIGDITTSKERGGLIGIFGGVRMLGQSVGPVFGGLLTQFLGFRSIFWSLTILGGVSLLVIIVFLPETLRSVAGDGTVPVTGVYKPIIYYVKPQPDVSPNCRPRRPESRVTMQALVAPLRFLLEKDVFITLLFGSVVYTIWSMVTSSTTSLFQSTYHLNSFTIGLAFLPNGMGCILGSYFTGILLDYDYRKTENEFKTELEAIGTSKDDVERLISSRDKIDPSFPIERARLRSIWPIVIVFVTVTATYGFSLSLDMDGALVLQFLIAFTATAVFTINSALVIDLYPGASASATAVNNLARCFLGAIGVTLIEPLIEALTTRFAFAFLAGIATMFLPLVWIEQMWGPRWRKQRAERQQNNVFA